VICKGLSVLIVVACVLPLCGCQKRLGDFTFLSSKNIDLSNLDMEAGRDAPRVEGVDSRLIILGFTSGPPNLKEAVDQAIESGRGTALSDVSIHHHYWAVPPFVGENKFVVRGKVVY